MEDATGAVVPNAKVTISDNATGINREVLPHRGGSQINRIGISQRHAATGARADGQSNIVEVIRGVRQRDRNVAVGTEIGGSANYIQQLLPEGEKVKILQWSGNCVATPEALAETVKAGLLNINGGDTLITRSLKSWTQMGGLGLYNGDNYQVYAPNQNENVYTHLWKGPFYGYERVIETFELTETPYRFKPINIYYHLYAVTKTASLGALNKVYQWALQQAVNPVFTSDYIHKVLDFNHLGRADDSRQASHSGSCGDGFARPVGGAARASDRRRHRFFKHRRHS